MKTNTEYKFKNPKAMHRAMELMDEKHNSRPPSYTIPSGWHSDIVVIFADEDKHRYLSELFGRLMDRAYPLTFISR